MLGESGGTAQDLAAILGIPIAAQLLVQTFAGYLADRFPHRKLTAAGNAAAALATAGTAALVALHAPFWTWILAQCISTGAWALTWPAYNGWLPRLTGTIPLQAGNAKMAALRNLSSGIGAATGGLIATLHPALTFTLAAALQAGAAMLDIRNKSPRTDSRPEAKPQNLRAAYTHFASNPWVWIPALLIACTASAWESIFEVTGPFIMQTQGASPGFWGLILGTFSIGRFTGGWLSTRYPKAAKADQGQEDQEIKNLQNLRTGSLGLMLSALVPAALILLINLPPDSPNSWIGPVILVMAALTAGTGGEIFHVVRNTAIQQHAPRGILSSALSLQMLATFAPIPLIAPLTGALIEHAGPQATLICTLVWIAIPGPGILWIRRIRRNSTENPGLIN